MPALIIIYGCDLSRPSIKSCLSTVHLDYAYRFGLLSLGHLARGTRGTCIPNSVVAMAARATEPRIRNRAGRIAPREDYKRPHMPIRRANYALRASVYACITTCLRNLLHLHHPSRRTRAHHHAVLSIGSRYLNRTGTDPPVGSIPLDRVFSFIPLVSRTRPRERTKRRRGTRNGTRCLSVSVAHADLESEGDRF